MQVEELPLDAGVARASIDGVENLRAIDVAMRQFGPGGIAGAAVKIFVERHKPVEHMLRSVARPGRYIPRAQLELFIDTLNDPETDRLARARVFGGMNKRKKEKHDAMTPITTEFVRRSGTHLHEVHRFTAVNVDRPIHYVINGRGLFVCVIDVALTLVDGHRDTASGYLAHWVAKLPESDTARYSIRAGGGRPKLFILFEQVPSLCQLLKQKGRESYRMTSVRPLLQRLEELAVLKHQEITDAALEAARPVEEPEPVEKVDPTAKAIAQAVFGDFPSLALPAITPQAPMPVPPWSTQADPTPAPVEPPRRTSAEDIVRRMGLVETGQQVLIERIDAVLAQKDEAIATRDRQIKSLQGLVVSLGDRCVLLLGQIDRLRELVTR